MIRRRSRSGRDDLPLTADINVTSLVDVAFTLLVIFIITAPVLQGGMEVSVPRADVPPITAQNRPLVVTIRRSGEVFVEDAGMTVDEFRSAFPQLQAVGEFDAVYVRADSLAPYGPVLQVATIIYRAGIAPSMVAEPWSGR